MGREVRLERAEPGRDLGQGDPERLHVREHTRRSLASDATGHGPRRDGRRAPMLGFRTLAGALGSRATIRGRHDGSIFESCQAHARGRPDPPSACSSSASWSPPAARPSSRSRRPTRRRAGRRPRPSPSQGPFVPTAYPADGDAPCGQAKAPDAQPRRRTPATCSGSRATDAATVVFELCDPDVAFLSRIAAPAFAINDTAGSSRTSTRRQPAPRRSSPTSTGPARTGSRAGTAARRSASPATTRTGAPRPATSG